MSNAIQAPPPPSAGAADSARARVAHALFLVYLGVMALLFLLPVPHRLDAAATRFDGITHFLIFFVYALLRQVDHRPAVARTLLGAVLLAGGVELIQWALPYRGAQWADFAAGVAGAVVGLTVSLLMTRTGRRALCVSGALLGGLAGRPAVAAAQGSPYIQLDDPRMARFELLVDRGVIPDPTPLVRPFTEAQAVAALRALSPRATASDSAQARSLLKLWVPPDTVYWGRVEFALGVQAATHARRDPVRPAGDGGVWPFGSLEFLGVFGPVVAHAELYGENRLNDDPDWPANITDATIPSELTYRYPVAYVSAQWKPAELFIGQLSREWGPRGVPGIPLSGWGYPYYHGAFNVGTRDIRLQGVVAQLEDWADTAGQVIHRYQVAHRLGVQVTPKIHLALWQTAILAGVDQTLNARWITPVGVMFLGNTLSSGDEAQLMFGGDGRIVLNNGISLEGQLAIDDFRWFAQDSAGDRPNRWAFTASVMGPVGSSGSWRALYTQVSTYALRTFAPEQDYINVGVGLGRQFVDGDQLTFTTTWPVRTGWVVTPELTFLRQGAAEITDSFPPDLTGLDGFLSGVVAKTGRLAVGVRGQQGRVRIQGNLGVNQTWNADHIEGNTATTFVAQVMATVRIGKRGALR
ncbi:MAG TPA: hypothetical protein P5319_07055 [Gemmatimonadales bacterium]|nr:hypothetical protein [Gemmatimonadales bacterium]